MNRDCFHEEIKKGLKSGNALCRSIQKLSSSRLSRRNTRTKIYRTMIFMLLYVGVRLYLTHRIKNVGRRYSTIR